MARLGSWGLLCFAVLALPGPPGAGAQGKGVRGGTSSSSHFDLGDGPRMFGGFPALPPSAKPRPLSQPGTDVAPGLLPEGVCVGGGIASMGFKKPPWSWNPHRPVLSTAQCPGALGGGEQQALLSFPLPHGCSQAGDGVGIVALSMRQRLPCTTFRRLSIPRGWWGLKAPLSPPPRGPRLHHNTWGASLGSSQGAALALVLVPSAASWLLGAGWGWKGPQP